MKWDFHNDKCISTRVLKTIIDGEFSVSDVETFFYIEGEKVQNLIFDGIFYPLEFVIVGGYNTVKIKLNKDLKKKIKFHFANLYDAYNSDNIFVVELKSRIQFSIRDNHLYLDLIIGEDKYLHSASRLAFFVQNDSSNWEDKDGEIYHYPSNYKNMVTEGLEVLFYCSKGKQAKMIFAYGIVDSIHTRTDDNRKTYEAKIKNYLKFDNPVDISVLINKYPQVFITSNKQSVRLYPYLFKTEVFDILKLEGLTQNIDNHDLDNNHILTKAKDTILKATVNPDKDTQIFSGNVDTTEIGDLGEEKVYKHLKNTLSDKEVKTLKWHGRDRDFCGYDISYINCNGEKVCIEVKSTVNSDFDQIFYSSNERRAMVEELNYQLYLVANVRGNSIYKIINNPIKEIEKKGWQEEPINYRLKF